MTIRIINIKKRPGRGAQGLVNIEGAVFVCALGRAGFSARKHEGDGATPLGRMRMRCVYVRSRLWPALRCGLPLMRIRPDLGWCDAPQDRNYNRPVRLPYKAAHERMWRPDLLYDLCIVLDWNLSARRRNRGSAIFLHLARPGFTPTEGCIALDRAFMRRLMPILSSTTVVRTSP